MKTGMKRGNLFLLELICNLFIFVLCAGVCVGLLLHAKAMSQESTELTDAVYAAQTAAEAWRSGNLDGASWRQTADSTMEKYFDTNGASVPDGQAGIYTLTLTELPAEGGVRSARISVCRSNGGAEIYGLTASVPEGVGGQ